MTNESGSSSTPDKSEKKNWFSSLSRRSGSSSSATLKLTSSQESSVTDDGTDTAVKNKKHKDERKNVFQRLKKRAWPARFSMRRKKSSAESTATASNLTEPQSEVVREICNQNDTSSISTHYNYFVPFSHQYVQFVRNKWLKNACGPNSIMYEACLEMLAQVWYWGEISRSDSQRELKDRPNGSFLVRDSETIGSHDCWFTVSFRTGKCTLHYRIERRDGYWWFNSLKYKSIVQMIDDIVLRCTRDNFVSYVKAPTDYQPPLAVVLLHPVSRYIKILKLQDLCRRVVQRNLALDDIPKLEIPIKLKEYLGEERGLVFQDS